ncbi:hypothetical protein [Streptomyces kronopolitis]|uniref:hypothetical protein n=1 Tax=Streptomyces kronopolitis TaxID=1612435 RepID=UPI00166E0B81|nr:hypothetical protein [Streptomyces kronopolitis]
MDRKRLQAVLHGRPERGTPPQERVRPAIAVAVLAVEPDAKNVSNGALVDATGTTRRLQALVAVGWPQAHLAQRLGLTPGNFGSLRRSHVTAGTRQEVSSLYRELWDTNPKLHGVSNRAFVRARNHAAAHHWAPPAAWDDDIDDPGAFPDWTGRCGTPDGYRAHRTAGVLPACEPCLAARRNVHVTP